MISHITKFLDLSDKPFVIHPHPMKEELLSSWLIRVSIAHDTLPWSFMNMHFPEYHNISFSRDIDVWAPEDMLRKLSIKSHFTYEQLYSLTLRSYIGDILPIFNPSGNNQYFSYIKVRGRSNKLYGQKYCPICLSKDETPYFRKQWRLVCITECIDHKTVLYDRCQKCKKPISIYKFNKKNEGFTRCWNCGNRLY